MLNIVLAVAAIVCAIQAIRASRLLISALWLAGASAVIALILYLMGAHEVAVIELSVGAGLVTILFVFAISVAGEEAIDVRTIIPKPLAWGLIALAVILLGWLTLRQPMLAAERPAANAAATSFTDTVWQQRGLDMLVQLVLIFAGVLGMLGLLGDAKTRTTTDDRQEIAGNGHLPGKAADEVETAIHRSPAAAPSEEVHS